MNIYEYIDEIGKSPFSIWFNSLDSKAAGKIFSVVSQMEMGNLSNIKSVGNGVYEKIIDYGPGYRIYFGKKMMRQ
jgi:putative addiction module killer protein